MKKQIEFDGTVAAAHESGMPTPSSRAPSDDVTRMTGVPFSATVCVAVFRRLSVGQGFDQSERPSDGRRLGVRHAARG